MAKVAPPFVTSDPFGGDSGPSPSSSVVPAVSARVVLDGNDQGLAAGQYAVLYQDGACLGSAKILATGPAADILQIGSDA